jgi:hypothetical protein
MYNGPCSNPYHSNIPPWPVFIEYLANNGMLNFVRIIKAYSK